MKKIFLLILVLVSIGSYGQIITQRASAGVTVEDWRWMAGYNAFLPRYADTTAADAQKGIDSSGAIWYNYTNKALYFRRHSPKTWNSLLYTGDLSYVQPGNFWAGNQVRFGDSTNNHYNPGLQVSSIIDSTNPNQNSGLVQYPFWGESRIGFTSSIPANFVTYGGIFFSNVKETNTIDWGSTNSNHPTQVGVYGGVGSITGASGTMNKAASFFATVHGSTGFEHRELFMYYGSVDHTANVKWMVGIGLGDVAVGDSGNVYFFAKNDGGDAAPPPYGNYFLFNRATTYGSYLGNAAVLIGDSTNNGSAALFQLTGGASITGSTGIGGVAVSNQRLTVYDGATVPTVISNSNNQVAVSAVHNTAGSTFYRSMAGVMQGAATSAAATGGMQGAFFQNIITASNTQNWSSVSGLIGVNIANNINTGASGTVSNVFGVSVGFAPSAMTTSNYQGVRITDPSGAGTVTSSAGLVIANFTKGTNNVNLLLGTTTIPTGANWSIYSSSTYNSHYAGGLVIGTTTVDASALLKLSSTTQGFGLMTMTAAQAAAISSPSDGLMVYVTDTDGTFTSVGFWGRVGGAWQKLNN